MATSKSNNVKTVKGTSKIIKIYADMIQYKKINKDTGKVWCLEDVPEKYREAVKAELAARG